VAKARKPLGSHRTELERPDDPGLQRDEWIAQRAAWVVWSLVIVAALAGLLGPGPFSSVTVESPDQSLVAHYERFLHYHNPTEIKLEVAKRDGGREVAEVHIDQSLLDRVEIRRIVPEPTESRVVDNGVIHVFSIPSGAESGEITYWLDYEKYGRANGQITLDGRSAVTLGSFVFP
jgi:hypothetical protein